MAYTSINFKTKRQLRDALIQGREVRAFNPGLGGDLTNYTGTVFLEGPHYPAPHTWYAEAKVVSGRITSVK